MAQDFIYCLVHYIDGVQIPFYVGRTNDLERRFEEHRYNLTKTDKAAYDYIKKNCLCEIFEMELLHTCTGTRQIDTEAYWVKELRDAGCVLTNSNNGDAVPHSVEITYVTAPGVLEARAANKIKAEKKAKQQIKRDEELAELRQQLGNLFDIGIENGLDPEAAIKFVDQNVKR